MTTLTEGEADKALTGRVTLTTLTASSAPLSKVQKQFNTLLAKIEAQRLELTQWNSFVPVFLKRMADDIRPLKRRYRERQIAMAQLLDRAIDGSGLGKAQRRQTQAILIDLLLALLQEADDAELVALHDKHADVSFEEEQQRDRALIQAITDKLHDDHAEVAPHADRAATDDEPRPARKRSAKALANEALREQTAQGASHAVREIYRKLVSELHPDREPDAAARARKTALMQHVNQAYEARDLLGLLELQLSIQQIDATALQNIAQDRLLHYNALLREQSRRLQEEIDDVKAPFTSVLHDRLPRSAGIDLLARSLDADVRELKAAIRAMDADLLRFEDIRTLKSSLKHQRGFA